MVKLFMLLLIVVIDSPVYAHHILGRPSYSLNEDSNTPSSLQVETQIGDYFVTYMVFPAFPRPNEPGRINLYSKHIDTGAPFTGEVAFTVRDDGWFSSPVEHLGVQSPDDNVYRQGFVFREAGEYVITARFEAGGEPYIIDFPLRVGAPAPIGLLGMAVGMIMLVLLGVKLLQRKRLQGWRIRSARDEAGQ